MRVSNKLRDSSLPAMQSKALQAGLVAQNDNLWIPAFAGMTRKKLMDLIQETILQHGRHSPFKGRLKDATLSAELENSLCGDVLRIDIKIANGQVEDIAFSGEGCLISQASASLLLGEVKKLKDLSKIKKFNQDTILKLLGIELTPSRIQCAMLSLKVLQKAFNRK